MDKERAYWALIQTAQKEDTTVEEVIQQIELSIMEAILNAAENQDWNTLERWRRIPCTGDFPTAAGLVAYIAETLSQ